DPRHEFGFEADHPAGARGFVLTPASPESPPPWRGRVRVGGNAAGVHAAPLEERGAARLPPILAFPPVWTGDMVNGCSGRWWTHDNGHGWSLEGGELCR